MMHSENNNPKRRRRLVSASLWFTLCFMVAAQVVFPNFNEKEKSGLNETFREIARDIESAYNSGNLRVVIKIYEENCGKGDNGPSGKEERTFKKVNKEIRADIYRWMFLTYSALDRQDAADIFLKKYLVIRHREGIRKAWLFLKNRARGRYFIAPRWQIGLKGGINFTFVKPSDRYNILERINNDEAPVYSYEKEYSAKLAHSLEGQVGMSIEYRVTKKISICTEPTYITQKFRFKNKYFWGDDDDNVAEDYTYVQWLTNIEVPILLKYRLLSSKLELYIQAGGFCGILNSALRRLNVDRSREIEGVENQYSYSDGSYTEKQLRSSYLGLCVGVGIGFSVIGNVLVEIEGTYKYRFNNIIDEKNRYKNDELCLQYYDVFDDMKLTNWELTLKILLPLSFKAFRK